MSDIDYISRKLKSLQEKAETSIGEAVLKVRLAASSHQSSGSSRARMFAEKAVVDGFLEEIQKMARVVIDNGMQSDPVAQAAFDATARALGDDLIKQHATAMFGSASFDRNADAQHREGTDRVRAKLGEEVEMAKEDLKRGIVGHSKHKPDPTISVGDHANVVTGSPGSNIQQGRDNLNQTIREGDVVVALTKVLNEIAEHLPSSDLSPADIEEVSAQIESMKAQLKTKTPDKSFLQRAGHAVSEILITGGGSALGSLAEKLIAHLPL